MYVPASTDVIRQHEPGDRFYIIEEGSAEVVVDGYVVGALGPGDSFGERALLRDVPRTATVRSLGPLHLLVLPREDFLTALTGVDVDVVPDLEEVGNAGLAELSRGRTVEILSKLNLFSHLDAREVGELAAQCQLDRWSDGDSIVRQGDPGDRYFVMLDGRAEVFIDGRQVNDVRAGDQFGEIALLHGVPRTADVIASTQATTLSLHRDTLLPALRARFLVG